VIIAFFASLIRHPQYGEHFLDLEDFHELMVQILAKPRGVYSFFNGLAPDNLFFHGVACQCVKVQLAALGLDSNFLPCEISTVSDKVWEGVRRKYWHGRDTYYLPVCTWNPQFLQTGQRPDHYSLVAAAAAAAAPGHNSLQQQKRKADESAVRTGDNHSADMETDGEERTTTTTDKKRLQTMKTAF
jgi:hypothetical protein